jgi:ABC-type Zn uptake system ZnuABC Zn-binding protein ZnuA
VPGLLSPPCRVALSLLVALFLLLSGCSPPTAGSADGKIVAVATTTQIADLLKNVAGDKVIIRVIMKEGSNHHTFEPTTSDVKLLIDAQIIFENGVELDSWLDRLMESSGSTATRVVTSAGVDLLDLQHEGHVHAAGDPHIWHSTTNAKIMVANIARGMAAFDPENSAFYEQNAQAYTAQLVDLATEIHTLLDPIPEERRKLVTSHEAFGYFAKEFDLRIVGTVVIASESAEPSSRYVVQLVQKIRAEQVQVIFTETTIDPRLAEQIAQEAGVTIIPNLYSDTLSEPGGEADTYIKMMRYNATVIAAGLQGEEP